MAERDKHGRFLPGNKVARGNREYVKAMRLRRVLLAAVTEDDLKAVIRVLLEKARAGDTTAAKEVLDRTIGRPAPIDVLSRLDELEARVAERFRLVRGAG